MCGSDRKAVYRDEASIQAQTPGSRDVLVFEDPRARGRFRQCRPFGPSAPFLFFLDPDGYVVEIWFEPPAPFDPPGPAAVETSLPGR